LVGTARCAVRGSGSCRTASLPTALRAGPRKCSAKRPGSKRGYI